MTAHITIGEPAARSSAIASRRQCLVGALLVAALLLVAGCAAPSHHLRVMSYNIHHGEGTDGRFDLQRLAQIINDHQPDLVSLQEVDRGTARADGVDQAMELARLTGMDMAYGKAMDYDGTTQLGLLHTHLLALGMLFFLIVMALEKAFTLSADKWFNLFYWHYNGGLALSSVMMLVIGIRDVAGAGENAAISGIAGLGHIIITVGLAFLFVGLYQRIKPAEDASVG